MAPSSAAARWTSSGTRASRAGAAFSKRIPDAGLIVGVHDLPDVVLEVDHTTDVRRGKLALYAAWGFPEVWVDVPDVPSPGRAPGLTVHRLAGVGYRTASASAGFPGLTAAEIHAALNEPAPDGTKPDDTPWLRRAREAGRAAERAAVLRAMLAGRGMADVEHVLATLDLGALPLDVLLDAARRCRDAADLRARLGAG